MAAGVFVSVHAGIRPADLPGRRRAADGEGPPIRGPDGARGGVGTAVWVAEGTVTVQSRHTTAAVVVNENEPLLLEDLEDALERWAPRGARYGHNDLDSRKAPPPWEKPNGHAHARALLLATSVALHVTAGEIDLGEWQSIFLVELDGPRAVPSRST